MARVSLEGVRKEYDNGFVAVHDATFAIGDGEFVVLVGPSGCGKSTTLRMIAGLEAITSGTLRIGDRIVNDLDPKDRDVAMVFQNYALYPHLDVYENVAFGLRLRKFPDAEVRERVERAADLLGLEPILRRKPKELSGGQRQRVALGRAIVRKPQVFLFDEPLSNLDAKLRVQTRTEISRLHRQLGATTVYVTHDQVEAMTMGDRIVVMKDGHVQQIAPPLHLYNEPANQFVAGFIGSPSMNFLEGAIVQVNGGLYFESSGLRAALEGGVSTATVPTGPVTLGIRPEDIFVAARTPTDRRTTNMLFTLVASEPMGNEIFVHAMSEERPVVARVIPQPLPAPGEQINLALDTAKMHLFEPTSGRSLAAPKTR